MGVVSCGGGGVAVKMGRSTCRYTNRAICSEANGISLDCTAVQDAPSRPLWPFPVEMALKTEALQHSTAQSKGTTQRPRRLAPQ